MEMMASIGWMSGHFPFGDQRKPWVGVYTLRGASLTIERSNLPDWHSKMPMAGSQDVRYREEDLITAFKCVQWQRKPENASTLVVGSDSQPALMPRDNLTCDVEAEAEPTVLDVAAAGI